MSELIEGIFDMVKIDAVINNAINELNEAKKAYEENHEYDVQLALNCIQLNLSKALDKCFKNK